jgi:uncharacterized protein (DUF488 family)
MEISVAVGGAMSVTSGTPEVLTIGHSTLSYEQFLCRLRAAGVTAVADVRTSPFSRHFPHFNQSALHEELRQDGIAYVFLGNELGGRPAEKELFCEGVADYEKMAKTKAFAKGLERVVEGAKKFKIALMCSEHNPLDCHRCLLVGRVLQERGVLVGHILANGSLSGHTDIEAQLLDLAGKTEDELFTRPEERLAIAYRLRAMKVAYSQLRSHPNVAAE